MRLFDDVIRDRLGPKTNSAPVFSYLNTSAEPKAGRIRDVLEEWFGRWPAAAQKELRRRLRLEDDEQHHAALFELYLHELFLRLGYRVNVSTVHDRRYPDFLVESPESGKLYVEATVVTNESAAESGVRKLKDRIYDEINRLDSPDCFLKVKTIRPGSGAPSGRRIREFLREQLSAVDAGALLNACRSGNYHGLPVWRYRAGGWEIDFTPLPKSSKLRGKPGVRPIGVQWTGPDWSDASSRLMDKILKKAGHYGALSAPYVIAADVLDPTLDETDEVDALFGREDVQIAHREDGIETRLGRVPDGVWIERSGARYTSVNAVLMARCVKAWTLGSASVRVYINPWATIPLSGELRQLPSTVVEGENLMHRSGCVAGAVLGLPDDWPPA